VKELRLRLKQLDIDVLVKALGEWLWAHKKEINDQNYGRYRDAYALWTRLRDPNPARPREHWIYNGKQMVLQIKTVVKRWRHGKS
jgi:hypothetical protein